VDGNGPGSCPVVPSGICSVECPDCATAALISAACVVLHSFRFPEMK
jgi:hypothetical protein